MEIAFMNADNLIRLDENLEKIEILRGGTSPIFGSSAAGATLNFLNKAGGTELEGAWKLAGVPRVWLDLTLTSMDLLVMIGALT
jgi:outer membrane receptor protein involved in Fe transport